MPWQPMHIAVLASSNLGSAGAAAAGLAFAAGADAAGAWASTEPVTQATARAKSVVNNLFILRAQSGERLSSRNQHSIISGAIRALSHPNAHEVPRLPELRRHARPDARGERG